MEEQSPTRRVLVAVV